jgi:hypothetical protein
MIKLLKERLPQPHPDWLRSARSFRDLPRVDVGPFVHAAPVEMVSIDGIVTRIIYILNNGTGAWAFGPSGFSFENDRDAKAFHARFPQRGELLTLETFRLKRASGS